MESTNCGLDARIEENIRLVYYLAGRARTGGMRLERDELVSLGMRGLYAAARAYNPERGVKFSTFAARVIQNDYRQALRANAARKRMGEGAARAAADGAAWEALEDPSGDIGAYVALRLDLKRALARMPPRARAMVILCGMGYTQKEIAQKLGVSQATCSKTIARARNWLATLAREARARERDG